MQKKDKTERVTELGRITRGVIQVESNDSPEIPDKGETSDIPGPPSGVAIIQLTQEQLYEPEQIFRNCALAFFSSTVKDNLPGLMTE